jgi:hypothetical protein
MRCADIRQTRIITIQNANLLIALPQGETSQVKEWTRRAATWETRERGRLCSSVVGIVLAIMLTARKTGQRIE